MATHTETHADAHGDHAHPTEKQYWIVFAALAILTALEIFWAESFEGAVLVIPLIAMMVVKFLLVAGAFMHLYFDLKIVNGRIFTWAFAGGIVLAIAVYFIVFAAFEAAPGQGA